MGTITSSGPKIKVPQSYDLLLKGPLLTDRLETNHPSLSSLDPLPSSLFTYCPESLGRHGSPTPEVFGVPCLPTRVYLVRYFDRGVDGESEGNPFLNT